MLAARLDEGFVGALHDALRADVDPRAGRHLAYIISPSASSLLMLPARPLRHEVGVGDLNARRVLVRLEHADGLPDWTSSVSSSSRRSSVRTMVSKHSQSRARGRCRHRPPAPWDSRRHRGRGCSSACGAALPSASSWPGAWCPSGARISTSRYRVLLGMLIPLLVYTR